jgi:hypothetical protein
LLELGSGKRAQFTSQPPGLAWQPTGDGSSSYNHVLSTSRCSMEAERLNQIEGTIADLRGRLAELRRYL